MLHEDVPDRKDSLEMLALLDEAHTVQWGDDGLEPNEEAWDGTSDGILSPSF